jgi:hypothetical protein
MSLEQFENDQLLKNASKMYFLGEQVANVFYEFETALYYLHRDEGFKFGFDLITRGFKSS